MLCTQSSLPPPIFSWLFPSTLFTYLAAPRCPQDPRFPALLTLAVLPVLCVSVHLAVASTVAFPHTVRGPQSILSLPIHFGPRCSPISFPCASSQAHVSCSGLACTHTPFPMLSAPSRGSLGALRLKVRLTEDRVLPSQHYQPLMDLLLESVQGPAEVGVMQVPPPGILGPGY